MVTGFVILGLVALGVALVARNRGGLKPGENPSRVGRAGIVPRYGRTSDPGTNGSSVGLLGLGGFDSSGSGGFDSGSCGTSDGGSSGGDSGGSC
ncbi:hypothetical protein [uncultured Williamsia sp.]|uniref:hypothetical protein n=1 Tax=uncultured Williamsia sp. TaxID=259311 RepID=UPI00260B5A31|nr:hypothetical protein [uncultured Williamsia sp.]